MSQAIQAGSQQDYVDVDIKKVDYTINNYEDKNELVSELEDLADKIKKGGDNAVGDDSLETVIEDLRDNNQAIMPVMHIFGRAPGGTKVHVRVHGVRPYFYVPDDEFDSDLENDGKVTGVERGFEGIRGERLVKVYGRIPGDIPKLRDEYTHYEADILFPNRFLIDNGIEGSISIPTHHATEEPSDIHIDQIRNSDFNEENRVCYCDIEVDDSKGFPDEEKANRRIISITVYDKYIDEYKIFIYDPQFRDVTHDEAKVLQYDSEADMLRSFIAYLHTRGFDTITGWNFSDFDARFIVNRLDYLGSNNDEELSASDASPLGSAYDDGWYGAKIKGIAVFDLLKGYKNLQFTELDSYSLEDVAQEELGTGKVDHEEGIYELWEDNVQKLVDYNVKDVKLTVDLDEQQEIIKFYEEIANYVGGRLSECIDASKAVDIKVLRAVNGKYPVPSAKSIDGEEFEGAEVFDPISGVKENVVVLDLASLYPMSMKTINAGPVTKDPDGKLKAPNGVSFNDEEDAIVVEIIDELLETRQKYKDLRDEHSPDSKQYKIYDRKQAAVKVVMNTLYGVLGWSRFRLYDEDVGAAVTAVGRECIKFTEKVVEELGYEVTYGDTDSVMIELGPDVTKEEAMEIGFELEEKINERYDDFAKEELNADEHWFDIEFEKLYRRYFQAGKKKRYAGHIVWKEGKDKDDIDTVGFETERSDYSKKAKEIIENTLEIIVRGGDLNTVSDYVRTEIDKLKEGEYGPDEFGIPSSIGKAFDQYDSPTLAVRASEYSNKAFNAGIQAGDKPKAAYVDKILSTDYDKPPETGDGKKQICWMNFNDVPDEVVWDWNDYVDSQIKGPIMRILSGTDWSWSEVITGKRQPKLGEFESETADDVQTFTIGDEEVSVEELEEVIDDASKTPEMHETQNMLDDFNPTDVGGSVVTANMVQDEEDDGPNTLDDYL